MQIVFTDGLGNEMFQYALYLAMKFHGHNPTINIGIINRNIVHNGFELCDDFEIEREKLNIYDGGKQGGWFTIFAVRHLKGLCCAIEDVNKFNPDVFNTKKPFVYGYWQDERYFLDIEDEIRKAFTFRNVDDRNRLLGDEMEKAQSVSLHIRRGDYLKYSGLQICTPSYYNNAIQYIKEHVENPIFYVFSDDLEWSEKFMTEREVNFRMVTHNRGRDSYKDMYLMTRCRHNIIANSSFSWWGAWLGKQEGKVVVCPNEWIKGYSKDPCPARWVRTKFLPAPYSQKKLSLWEIIIKEYNNLGTGRKPALIYGLRTYFMSETFKLIVLVRMLQNSKSTFKQRLIINKLLHQYGVEISKSARIGNNLRFHHSTGIVIGKYVVIGENCHIFQGVCIGQSKGLFPIIGRNVTLYPYSIVLGDVHIGDNVIVAAHSVVTHDVPSNCMVAGNPAKIIKYLEGPQNVF